CKKRCICRKRNAALVPCRAFIRRVSTVRGGERGNRCGLLLGPPGRIAATCGVAHCASPSAHPVGAEKGRYERDASPARSRAARPLGAVGRSRADTTLPGPRSRHRAGPIRPEHLARLDLALAAPPG